MKYGPDVHKRIAALEAKLKKGALAPATPTPGVPAPAAPASKPPAPTPPPVVPSRPPAVQPTSASKPARTVTSPAPGAPQSRTRTLVAWTALGLGAACAVAGGVLLGVGGVQGADAAAAYEAERDPRKLDAAWDDVAAANTKVIAGYVLLGAAAAGLGVSLYSFITRSRGAERPGAEVKVTAGPAAGGAAVLLRGTF